MMMMIMIIIIIIITIIIKVKWSRYRPGVAQRVGRVIALLFHNRGTKRGWVVSSTPRPHFIPEIEPVPIVQEAGWAPGPVWTGGKSRSYRDSTPDRPAHSQRYTDWATQPIIIIIIIIIIIRTEPCSQFRPTFVPWCESLTGRISSVYFLPRCTAMGKHQSTNWGNNLPVFLWLLDANAGVQKIVSILLPIGNVSKERIPKQIFMNPLHNTVLHSK